MALQRNPSPTNTADKGRYHSCTNPGALLDRNAAEADELAEQVRAPLAKSQAWIVAVGCFAVCLQRARGIRNHSPTVE